MKSLQSTNGCKYWFSGYSGKIWEDNAGTYTLVYTIVPGTGEAKILGAFEYQEYIYFATESKLHRIKASLAIGAAQWTLNVEKDWQTFTIGDKSFHPFFELNLVLYIGDGYLVDQVDAGVWSAAAVDVNAPLRIKTMNGVGTQLLIGTFIDNNINKTTLYVWDTYSQSFADGNEIDEVGINAILKADNLILVQAGLSGKFYLYDPPTNTLNSYKTIPGDYSPTKWGRVNPDAVANLNGTMLLGFSNGLGNPGDQGVYAIGRYDNGSPFILTLPFPISERENLDFAVNDIEIGSILVVGFDIYVSWKHHDTYGIDKLDYSTKVEAAYIESRVFAADRMALTNFSKFSVNYYQIPTSTNVEIHTSFNYAAYVKGLTKNDVQRNTLYCEEGGEATTIQLKLKFITSGNTAPEIESAGINIT
jgi:hypothetical protein